ncbi:MAG: hypothetical protein U9P07_00525 [Pseudomonadota bacterium]|nr:hypothetical protein [Pseudomonadota bacterium]
MSVPKYILRHTNYNADDYSYLHAKGWTNKEIKLRWDQERRQGKGPCLWNGQGAQSKLAAVLAGAADE